MLATSSRFRSFAEIKLLVTFPPPPATDEALDACISSPSPRVLETLAQISGSIAVLGAGGKMGLHLAQMLQRGCQQLGRPATVTAVSRFGSVHSRAEFAASGITTLAADLSDPAQLQRLPEFEHLFFLAGVKFGTAHQPELLEQMNIRMPQLVAARYPAARFVALSTGCVYSFTTPESGGSRETDPTAPPGDYARSCLGREQAFQHAATEYGTRSSLIRLNYSIDLRYGVLVDLAQQLLTGQPIDLEMGYVNLIWQGDALDHIIQSLNHASAPPFVINVTGSQVLSVRSLAEQLAQELGVTPQFTGSSQPTAWLSQAERAHALLGPPRMSVAQMIAWTAAWLRQGNSTWNRPTHFETRGGAY